MQGKSILTRSTKPVRIFSAGKVLPSGKIADAEFLNSVVRNWKKHQSKQDPKFPNPPAYLIPAASISIGHEENSSIAKQYAERTDLPAIGWPTDVAFDGHFLTANFTRVPIKLAQWIEAGAYTEVSAEFYEDYEKHGPCLRRVALLGAEIPACKDLGGLPAFEIEPEEEDQENPLAFSERMNKFAYDSRAKGATRFKLGAVGTGYVIFSEIGAETKTMNPHAALLTALQSLGIDVSKLDAAGLESIAAACKPAVNAEPTDEEKKKAAMAEEEAKKVAANAEEEKKKADDAAKFAEIVAAVQKAMPNHDANHLAKFTETFTKVLDVKLEASNRALEAVTKKLAESDREKDRATVAAFCEANKDRIYPYEFDAKAGVTIVDRLLALPNTAVATFAEGKISPRDAEMKAIMARPQVAKFHELIGHTTEEQQNASSVEGLLALTSLGRDALAAKKAAATK